MPQITNINKFILKKCKRLFLNDPSKIFLYPLFKKVFPYTLIGYVNLSQVYDAVDEVIRENVSGAIVEMGSYKGGCGVLMAYTSKKMGDTRITWLFDSFEGLPEFSEHDKEKADAKNAPIRETGESAMRGTGIFKANKSDVHEVAGLLGVSENIRVVEGWFQDTVESQLNAIGQIALLRLDADLYESTKYCLDQLYDLVSPGGMIIIDDYGTWAGCNKAVYEFFAQRGINPPIFHYPYGGRAFFRKPRSS